MDCGEKAGDEFSAQKKEKLRAGGEHNAPFPVKSGFFQTRLAFRTACTINIGGFVLVLYAKHNSMYKSGFQARIRRLAATRNSRAFRGEVGREILSSARPHRNSENCMERVNREEETEEVDRSVLAGCQLLRARLSSHTKTLSSDFWSWESVFCKRPNLGAEGFGTAFHLSEQLRQFLLRGTPALVNNCKVDGLREMRAAR
ncbi:unnamed protein product [Nesidiocoris tenuis]|uniref:Transmembrane protein n=1 Tax=Nesidiocoris tenuis TaxID=355587 RepID=A0A6H5G283_9HEMI|nr:unnamed protein product [Nesidiocoris tenuis]